MPVMARPGTRKTYTLVQREIFLIQGRGVEPEQTLMATFTEKAGKELQTSHQAKISLITKNETPKKAAKNGIAYAYSFHNSTVFTPM